MFHRIAPKGSAIESIFFLAGARVEKVVEGKEDEVEGGLVVVGGGVASFVVDTMGPLEVVAEGGIRGRLLLTAPLAAGPSLVDSHGGTGRLEGAIGVRVREGRGLSVRAPRRSGGVEGAEEEVLDTPVSLESVRAIGRAAAGRGATTGGREGAAAGVEADVIGGVGSPAGGKDALCGVGDGAGWLEGGKTPSSRA